MSYDPHSCSDPPEESCADAGCPVHGDDEPSMAERLGITEDDLAESDAWWEKQP